MATNQVLALVGLSLGHLRSEPETPFQALEEVPKAGVHWPRKPLRVGSFLLPELFSRDKDPLGIENAPCPFSD